MKDSGARHENVRAALVAMDAEALVERVAELLRPTPILLLKGVALLEAYGDRPRLFQDVDLLVPSDQFANAKRTLLEAGFAQGPASFTSTAAVLVRASDRIGLDLHHRVFARATFALSAEQMFQRAEQTDFGYHVRRPAPLDLYAHAIGHFAKSGLDRGDHRVQDFAVIRAHYQLEPSKIAAHLAQHGLALAARYALSEALAGGDEHARDVLDKLPKGPLGRTITAVAKRQGLTRRLGVHLLNGHPARVALALPTHSIGWALDRIGERLSSR